MNLEDLPDNYADVMLEVDDETIFSYNTSIPYSYKYETLYYTSNEYKKKQDTLDKIKQNEQSSEEKNDGFRLLKKLFSKKIIKAVY
jgi:RecA-family ATPase